MTLRLAFVALLALLVPGVVGSRAAEPWADARLPVKDGLELWLDAGWAVPNSIGSTLMVINSGFTGNEAVSAAGDGFFALAEALTNQFGSTAGVSSLSAR
jgi:hypothetical protein